MGFEQVVVFDYIAQFSQKEKPLPIGKTAPVPVLSPPGGFKIRDAS
jgi:hypothetical protein